MPGLRPTETSLFCGAVKDLLVEADLLLQVPGTTVQTALLPGAGERQWRNGILESIWEEVDRHGKKFAQVEVAVKTPDSVGG